MALRAFRQSRSAIPLIGALTIIDARIYHESWVNVALDSTVKSQ